MRTLLFALAAVFGLGCFNSVHDNHLGSNDGGTGGGTGGGAQGGGAAGGAQTGGGTGGSGGGSQMGGGSGGGSAGGGTGGGSQTGGGTGGGSVGGGSGGGSQTGGGTGTCAGICASVGAVLTPNFAAAQLEVFDGQLYAVGNDLSGTVPTAGELTRIDVNTGVSTPYGSPYQTVFSCASSGIGYFPVGSGGAFPSLYLAPPGGGTASPLVPAWQIDGTVQQMEQLGSDLYVSSLDSTQTNWSFQKVSVVGGSPVDALPSGTVNGHVRRFLLYAAAPGPVTDIFYSDSSGVNRFNLSTAHRTSLASDTPSTLFLDGTTLWFESTTSFAPAFGSVDINTGASNIGYTPLASEGTPALQAVADGRVFYTTWGTGQVLTLREYDVASGTVQDVFPGGPVDDSTASVWLTSDAIYYSGHDVGAVWKRARGCCGP